MKKYFCLTIAGFKERISFRAHFICNIFSNLIYIFLVYYLWKAIFISSSSDEINGMTFMYTFLYLSIANAMNTLMEAWVEWDMSRDILNGKISFFLVQPINFQYNILFRSLGVMLSNFLVIFLPSLIIFALLSDNGIANIPVYLISLILAVMIRFSIDFITGIVAFYTENIWGVSITKNVLIAIFSGALIPILYYPEFLQVIIKGLPFYAIYHIPISILLNKFDVFSCLKMLLIQLLWAVGLAVLGRALYNRSIKIITVNGG